MTEPAIDARGVGKRYQTTGHRAVIGSWGGKRTHGLLWALRNVDLTVEPGGVVGVIGRNGSGKTTMLRLLSGVTAPSEGRVRVVGRIAPLIGVGVGFDPELTGRENVFVNGQLLGMSVSSIRARLDDIVAFSELSSFLDSPVKLYSSGMYLRLAFSVAVHVEPEVLMIDEVLAVGDAGFQARCIERLEELTSGGTTVVVVSHNMDLVYRLCPRTVLLHGGAVAFDGDTDTAVHRYHELLHLEQEADIDRRMALDAHGGPPFVGGATVSAAIEPGAAVDAQQELLVRLHARFREEVVDPCIGLAVRQPGVGDVYVNWTEPGEYRGTHDPDHPLDLELHLAPHLLPGRYDVQVVVYDPTCRVTLGLGAPVPLSVSSTGRAVGLSDLDLRIGGDRRPVGGAVARLTRGGRPEPR